MIGSGKVNKNMYHIFAIKSENQEVFWTFHVAVMQSTARKCTRKCAAIRPIVVFHSSGQGHPTFNISHFTHRVKLFFVESKKET